ncbi:MAG: NADP-dependent oxidoreductase [Bryobacteraceae bacterium]|nr:NADP-dependent oxidoreductase [Bryobacteraceae bacterium]
MKAIMLHEYGGPEVLKLEEAPDPVVGAGQVLVAVAAASINPLDVSRRSGIAKGFFPVQFPGILGADLSGTVLAVGPGVDNFSVGDRVFGMGHQSYAELCAVPAANLAKVPAGLKLTEAAALPLVTLTGNQLVSLGTRIEAGQTVLVAGAMGSVGRSAVFTARARGAKVIAGVLKRHLAEAGVLHADQVVATDDDDAMANLPAVDAVADAVGGKTGAMLISKVKPGGVFATVLSPPPNAGDFPNVEVVRLRVHPDATSLLEMAEAVVKGELTIPISRMLPLSDAAEGHAAVEKRAGGKVVLVVDKSLE